jgi:hypothetical protein
MENDIVENSSQKMYKYTIIFQVGKAFKINFRVSETLADIVHV